MSFDIPIFVRGFSRSGGTLLVSILDSHPQISMNYELYEGLLAKPNQESHAEFDVSGDGHSIEEVKNILEKVCSGLENQEKIALKALRDANFNSIGVFMARMARGGLLSQDFYLLVHEWTEKGNSWNTSKDRLEFIGFCAKLKSDNENTNYWGLKCNNSFEAYLKIWPKAKFINITRDPRDIYASQLVNGNFNPIPEKVSNDWIQLHEQFEQFKSSHPQNAYAYKYEDLVDKPEPILIDLFSFLEIPYNSEVLRFNEQNLTIFDNPRGHLSIDRISKPIDRSSVGRYRQEVPKEDIMIIENACENMLQKYRYS